MPNMDYMTQQEKLDFAKKYGLQMPSSAPSLQGAGTQAQTAEDGLRELEEWRKNNKPKANGISEDGLVPDKASSEPSWFDNSLSSNIERTKGLVKSVTDLPRTSLKALDAAGGWIADKIGETKAGQVAGDMIRDAARFGDKVVPGYSQKVGEVAQGVQEAKEEAFKPNPITSPSNEYQEQGKLVGDIAQGVFMPSIGAPALAARGNQAAKVAGVGSKVLPAAGKLLGEGLEAGAMTALQTGDAGSGAKAGGISTLVTLPFAAAKGLVKSLVPKASGVAQDVYADVFSRPEKYESAANFLKENAEQPFFRLAQDLAAKGKQFVDSAKEQWRSAASAFIKKDPFATFDVGSTTGDIKKALEGKNGLGFRLELTPGKEGGLTLKPSGKVSAWSQDELGKLNGLVDTVTGINNARADDILELDNLFDAAYNAVPFAPNGAPTRYHAAVMAISEATREALKKSLPKELREAYAGLANAHKLQQDFLENIADRKGNVLPSAEGYLKSLSAMNRGQRRSQADVAGQALGTDIVDEVRVLRNAQQLASLTTESGGPIMKALQMLVSTGGPSAAVAAGNPLLAALPIGAAAAASPAITSSVVKNLGKLNKKVDAQTMKELASTVLRVIGRLSANPDNQ